MSKIAIDTSPLDSGHQNRGVGTYTRELTKALKKQNEDLDFLLDPSFVNSDDIELVHYPYFDLFFHTLPILKKKKTVITLHDVIPLLFPEYFPVGLKGSFNFFLQKIAIQNVDAVITDSNASQKDIFKYLGIPKNKIFVTPLAASSDFHPASKEAIKKMKQKYNLPDKFLLFVGSINYNKNIDRLIQAVAELGSIPLVINTRTDIYSDESEKQTRMVLDLVKQALIKAPENLVHIVQMETVEELNQLYSAAEFYIQPSLAEGFGLPVLEAMQTGTPVLSSNLSSLPEVAGDAGIYFDPKEVKSIKDTINKALSLKPSEKESQAEKGFRRAKEFSWEKTAQETIRVYKKVLNN